MRNAQLIHIVRGILLGAVVLAGSPGCVIASNPALFGLSTDHGAASFAEAERLFNVGQFDAALPVAERALAQQEAQNASERILLGKTTNLLGRLWAEKGDHARSYGFHQRTLQLWEGQFGLNQGPIAIVVGNLAMAAQELGRYAEADALMVRAFEILEKSSGTEGTELGMLLNLAGRLRLEKGEYEQAKAPLLRAIQILEPHSNGADPVIAAIYGNLAESYLGTAAFADAIKYYERAVSIARRYHKKPHPTLAMLLGSLGVVYNHAGDSARAEPLLLEGVKIAEITLGPDHPQTGLARSNLGVLYSAQGKHAQAEVLLRQVLADAERICGPQHDDVALAANNLAMVVSELDHVAEAEKLMLRALGIWEKLHGPKHPKIGTVLSNLAGLYRKKGEVAKAQEAEQRAWAVRLQSLGQEHPDTMYSSGSLATLSVDKGDYLQGEELTLQLLAEAERRLGPDHIDVANKLILLARIYTDKGDPKRAEPLLVRAMTIQKKILGPEHPLLGLTANEMGRALLTERDPLHAAEFFELTVRIFEKAFGPDNQALASPLGNLALALESQGNPLEAADLYARALRIDEKFFGSEHPKLAFLHNNIGLLYLNGRKYDLAEQSLLRAQQITERAAGSTHPMLATIGSNLATLSWRRADLRTTIKRVEQLTAIQDQNAAHEMGVGAAEHRRAYFDTMRSSTDMAISLHVQWTGSSAEAKDLALRTILRRKGLTLNAATNTFANLRARLAPADRETFDRWRNITTEYSALVQRAQGAAQSDEHRAALEKLNEARKKVENELSFRSKNLQAELRPVTVEQIQSAIPSDAALVELFQYAPFDIMETDVSKQWGAPRFAAYVLHPNGTIHHVDLGATKPIEEAVREFRKGLSRVATNPRPAARNLYQMVMAPIVELLGKTTRIYLSPDGVLSLVPFGALVDRDDRYVVETMGITYLTTGRDLLHRSNARSSTPPAIFSAPDYGIPAPGAPRQFEQFRAGSQEGRDVEARLPGALFVDGNKATESTLKALHGPAILHISTHGFFDKGNSASTENALLRSGLAFAGANNPRDLEDGVVTALEASQLDLWGTKLVVLSACETGLGQAENGDGVYGLRRAFTIAGAETVVMSLWQVDTAATSETMKRYYDGLAAKEGRAEALRKAQLTLLASKERSHPHYWAGFIVSGNDAPISSGSEAPLFGQVKPGVRGCACETAIGNPASEGYGWLLPVAAACIARQRRRIRALPSSAERTSL